MVAWAVFSVIIISAFRIAGLIDGYPILPRLACWVCRRPPCLGAPVHIARSLDPPLRCKAIGTLLFCT